MKTSIWESSQRSSGHPKCMICSVFSWVVRFSFVIPVGPCRSTVINSPVPRCFTCTLGAWSWDGKKRAAFASRNDIGKMHVLIRYTSTGCIPPTLDEKHFGSTIADVFGFSLQQHGVRQSSSGGKVVRCGASVCLWPKKPCGFVICLFGSSHQKTSIGMSCSSLLVRSG